MATIEGKADPAAVDFVSNLAPKVADARTAQCFEHDPEAVAAGLKDTCQLLGKDQNALKLRLQIAAECIEWQSQRIMHLEALLPTPLFLTEEG